MRISDWSSDVCSSDLLALSIEPFVLFSRAVGAGPHDEIVAAWRVAGFSPRVVQEASQVTSIVNTVASGTSVSSLPASMHHINTDRFTFCPFTHPVPHTRLRRIWHNRNTDPQPLVTIC